ncbi:hypothetical protein CKO25_12610 [Thiocapsa imhoffii]|uniref:Uncharacterized protein n=1 Tax=Thiocapsa imhoffii TaxID=382777 RepID=A0A9X1B909_9GAMM|nr:hypothetical protein [Thiocapsa imhoffii]MBK1645469.1 hypothetical protein [Thiocapsa imhoffii]
MLKLTPPLTVIEANLFDPSLSMLRRWSESGSCLSPADPLILVEDPECVELLNAWKRVEADIPDPPITTPPRPMRASLATKVRQRCATQDHAPPLQPQPGLIVRLDRVMDARGPLGWDLPQPLAVLLSEPTEERNLWYGWLMASETDYASHWDLVLDDRDEPRDPLAAMVQIWNPVHLYWPAASAVLGQLQPARLAAVRDLAVDLGNTPPPLGNTRAGTLVQRTTSGGHLVITGTPLGDSEDPRQRYRELYFAAADLVRDMARQSITQEDWVVIPPNPNLEQAHQSIIGASSRPWWQSLLETFKEGARAAGLPHTPEPIAALGPAEPEAEIVTSWQLADWISYQVIPGAIGDSVRLRVRLLQCEPLLVGLERGKHVRQQTLLTAEMPETDLIAGANQELTFFIRDATGTTLYALSLKNGQD